MDTQGFVLRAVVHEASWPDRDGARRLLDGIRERAPRLQKVWADMGYRGEEFQQWHQTTCGCEIEIVQKPAKTVRHGAGETPAPVSAFTVLPCRWVVERTFGWIGRGRRMSKDYECLPETSAAWIYVGISRLMAHRLVRLVQQRRTEAMRRTAEMQLAQLLAHPLTSTATVQS